MTKSRNGWALAILFLACLSQLSKSATVEGSTRSQIDSVFAPLADGRSPGCAVLIKKDGRTIVQAGYGVRELRSLAKIDYKTNFRLASFTKQFTAMAAMLLVHDGKLRYDQPLTEIFPDFPSYGRGITVRHLLTHTAGLPDYENLMEVASTSASIWTATHQIQDEEVMALLRSQSAGKFAPGTSWAYSNSGYVVLGLIVSKVSGQSFAQFLHDRIFAPLQMNETAAAVNSAANVVNRALGHVRQVPNFVEADQSSTSATLGDGGIYSNLSDLAKWDSALERNLLLTANEMAPALRPVKLADGSPPYWPAIPDDDNLNPGKPVSYGFGWFLDSYKNRPRMWHSGTTMGFRTVIDRFTSQKLTVVILANRTDLDVSSLALRVADIILKHSSKS